MMVNIYGYSEDQEPRETWCASVCHRNARERCTQDKLGRACVPDLRERIAALEVARTDVIRDFIEYVYSKLGAQYIKSRSDWNANAEDFIRNVINKENKNDC